MQLCIDALYNYLLYVNGVITKFEIKYCYR